MEQKIYSDAILSISLTIVGAALAVVLIGEVPLVGIDDAAITRSYSENLARGEGYVYNIGGERVEGSTAFLWVAMLTAIYALTPNPEVPIIALCGILTCISVFFTVRLTRCLGERLSGCGNTALAVTAVCLLASPGYFLWSVWSMMELALWSAMILLLLVCLVKTVESDHDGERGGRFSLILPALALPMIRPEGVAVALGLIALWILLAPRFWRRGIFLMAVVITAFGALTTFRIVYFGQPLPNTFYAKVSSDTVQGLVDGAKYATSFALGAPFTDFFLVTWIAAAAWALLGTLYHLPGARGMVIVAASIFGLLCVYAALGGDHFALWRFYQPIVPLLPLAFALAVSSIEGAIADSLRWSRFWRLFPYAIGSLAMLAMGWMHFYQARFDLAKEYELTERGIVFGQFLNTLEPLPSVAVGPAGGIALTYEGYLYDIFGLNWTEMAHAKPEKIGKRNHASFDKATFLSHQPDLFATFNRPCEGDGSFEFPEFSKSSFDGIFTEDFFRSQYVPVLFLADVQCWPGFASQQWLGNSTTPERIKKLTWVDIRIIE